MIFQIFQDYLFVVSIKILLLFSNVYVTVIQIVNFYFLVLYVLNHAIQIRVQLKQVHKGYKLMVEKFPMLKLMVVVQKLEIVVVVVMMMVDHHLIQSMNYCLYLFEMKKIMFVLIEFQLNYLQNIQLEQREDIQIKVNHLYQFD